MSLFGSRKNGLSDRRATGISCPHCAEVNPAGYVWCKACKRPLELPKSGGWSASSGLTIVIAVLFAISIIVVIVATRPQAVPLRSVEGGAPPASADAEAARKNIQNSLSNWARAIQQPSSSTLGSGSGWPSPVPLVATEAPSPPAAGLVAPAGPPTTVREVDPGTLPQPSSAAPGPLALESLAIRQDGDQTIYELKLRYREQVYTVAIRGRLEQGGEGPRFVPASVDTGGLPLDADELKRSLGAALGK